MTETPDPNKESRDRIIERVYHEDSLLVQRTSYFVSAHAFLVIAYVSLAVVTISPALDTAVVQVAVLGLGLSLAYLSTALGLRTLVALSFWRVCEKNGVAFSDDLLFKFFKDGEVSIPPPDKAGQVAVPIRGRIVVDLHPAGVGQSDKFDGRMFRSWPWRFDLVGSPNQMSGVLFPVVTGIFWVVLAFALTTPAWNHIPLIGTTFAIVSLAAFSWTIHRRPRQAKWQNAPTGFLTVSNGPSPPLDAPR